MPDPIYCLMGPTASGKTALACELIQSFPFEIISVDSALIYQEMDVGTAKPTPEELEIAPHHLINIIKPNESYSVARFCTDVKELCIQIKNKGKIPLLVGGTMMYFNALQKGLSSLPEANNTIRAELLKQAENLGWENLYSQVVDIDPQEAIRIKPQDKQRIIRALEVYAITGQPMSSFFGKMDNNWDVQFVNILLFPENRAWLHERIKLRLDRMLAQNFLDEVKHILKKWQLEETAPALRTVGYRQAVAFLAGEYDYLEFYEKALAATRQLAKRQLTWLRSWEDVYKFDPEDPDYIKSIKILLKKIL